MAPESKAVSAGDQPSFRRKPRTVLLFLHKTLALDGRRSGAALIPSVRSKLASPAQRAAGGFMRRRKMGQ